MARPKPVKIVQMNLRVHEDLRDKIAAEADKRGVSINREMERRLQESMQRVEIEDIISKSVVAMAAAMDPRLNFMSSQLNLITKHIMEKFQ